MEHQCQWPHDSQNADNIEMPYDLPSQPLSGVHLPKVAPSQATKLETSYLSMDDYEQTFFMVNRLDRDESDVHQSTGTSVIEPGSILDANGRTYQGYREGKYFLPNDPAEQDRLDFQHAAIKILLQGKLYLAPVKQPRRVLDFATGTGIWALEFAQQNPASTVIGSDISLIQPQIQLSNCSFVREDMEEPWAYEPGSLDYIHTRWIYTCLSSPKTVIQSAFEALAPGGWIEFQDGDPFIYGADTMNIKKAIDLFIAGGTTIGRDFRVARTYKGLFEAAGFIDVEEITLPFPLNEWSTNPILKKVGAYNARQLTDHLRAILWKVVQLTGLSIPEMEQLVSECKREIHDPSVKIYCFFYIVYGRKPYEGEISTAPSSFE